jgi:hypothetical protein
MLTASQNMFRNTSTSTSFALIGGTIEPLF